MRFLVIGELGLDRFVIGSVGRLCPEAPCCVLNPIRETENWGMAGNVAQNLRSLAPDVEVVTITQERAIVKTRYIDEQSGYILLRVDDHDMAEDVERNRLEEALSKKWDAILVSSYDKGFLGWEEIQLIGRTAKAHGIPTFLDTKRNLDIETRDYLFVKINEKEWGRQPEGALYNCRNVIVTLGNKGSKWVNENVTVPVEPVAVSDVSGAGDTYMAAFALAYVRGYKDTVDSSRFKEIVKNAMDYANRAARIAVSKRGVVSVAASEMI